MDKHNKQFKEESMEEILKHELLWFNFFLWLAIQRPSGELTVTEEEYLELKKVVSLIGQSELMQNASQYLYKLSSIFLTCSPREAAPNELALFQPPVFLFSTKYESPVLMGKRRKLVGP